MSLGPRGPVGPFPRRGGPPEAGARGGRGLERSPAPPTLCSFLLVSSLRLRLTHPLYN